MAGFYLIAACVLFRCLLLHVGKCTPIMEYNNADDFSCVFITKRRESYPDIHIQSDLA